MVRSRVAIDRPAVKAEAQPPQNGKSATGGLVLEAIGSVEKCINCRFYDRRHAKPLDGKAPLWGQCRRHAPMLNPVTAKAYVVEGIWPLVRDDDWCGEWKILLHECEGSQPDAPAVSADELPPAHPTEPQVAPALGDD